MQFIRHLQMIAFAKRRLHIFHASLKLPKLIICVSSLGPIFALSSISVNAFFTVKYHSGLKWLMTQYWSKRLLLKGKSLNKVFLLLQNNNFPYSYIIWNVLLPISLWIVATYGLTSKKYSKNDDVCFREKASLKSSQSNTVKYVSWESNNRAIAKYTHFLLNALKRGFIFESN